MEIFSILSQLLHNPLSSEGFYRLSNATSPTAKCRFGSKFAVVSRISPSRKKASVQIARFMMVSCSVADELKTDLIQYGWGNGKPFRSRTSSEHVGFTCTACNFGIEAWSGDGRPIET